METYIGSEIIQAQPMTRGEYNTFRGWTIPADEKPCDQGFLVKRGDDQVTWCPIDTFNAVYRKSGQFDIGMAVKLAKLGLKVARIGWNGSGMFVYYVPANSYPATTDAAKSHFGDLPVPYRAYLALKTAQNDVAMWAPSGSDALAEDWVIIP